MRDGAMKYRAESAEVFYTDQASIRVGVEDIKFLKEQARKNPRGRSRLCTHKDPQAVLHEMLIVHGRDVYVRPHRHLGKEESFHVIEGSAQVVVFENDGRVRERVPVGDAASGRAFYFRLREPLFHSLIIESEFFVFHEVTSGPFERDKTEFAAWSPEDEIAGRKFLNELK